MHRGRQKRGPSRGRFNERASKTHVMNMSSPLRGGWRL
nr:MAG: hypothetical protein [Microvirus sp.]